MQMQQMCVYLSTLLVLLTFVHTALGAPEDSVCKTGWSSSTEVEGPGVCTGDVFLRGNYVEVGIHQAGSYGSKYPAPLGTNYPYQNSLGTYLSVQRAERRVSK